jgi:Fur family ferric uptake transcriptional regulator
MHRNSKLALEKKILELLKIKNLSITLPRKAILLILLKEHGPFTAEEIFNSLPLNTCDQVTVYRCLKQFVETQIVNLLNLEKDFVHYEFNDPNHHHHHIICKLCKRIDSFHDCVLDKIEKTLAMRGYNEIQHRLEFFGICSSCQKS